jgi:hemerythrin-like domain-containing protein
MNEKHDAITELTDDHKIILEELEKLDAAIKSPPEHMAEIEEFLEFTESFAEPHHQKEEKVLFPALADKGIPSESGPIAVMLAEHMEKRGHVRNLRIAMKCEDYATMQKEAEAIILILRNHILKEDNILYPIGRKVFNREELEELSNHFRSIAA